MKIRFFLLFSLFILGSIITSCSKYPTCKDCEFTCLTGDEDNAKNNRCKGATCDFEVLSNTTVDTTQFGDNYLIDGDQLVFHYKERGDDNPRISDDVYTNYFVFEIPTGETSFSYEDAELADIMVSYRRSCFCANIDWQKVVSGCLEGERFEDGYWAVQANLEFEFQSLSIEATFEE